MQNGHGHETLNKYQKENEEIMKKENV